MLDKVLCVDDDAVTLMLLEATLRKARFARETATAVNGLEAQKLLEAGDWAGVDLLLLDLNMPVKNGWQLLDEMQAWEDGKLGKTKVVVLSSSINPDDQKKAEKYKFVIDFLSKPLTLDKMDALKNNPYLRIRFVQSR